MRESSGSVVIVIEMKNIIIGTAGHVDHGKTTLIKALSGIDTDRLDEEKKRGITIELGFAHIPNDAGYNIGVIDVPGHEKFIKHMLAGIGGIDFVLFVVAADEGIMPQTKEHFEILQSLGINDGIIAVTKSDMVEPEWMELMLEEIREYFEGTFLDGKPVITVSAVTGENLDVLMSEIIAKCDRETKRREEKELFRLPADRVFTMQGFGTVVTGTLMDGAVSTGDDVFIYPEGIKAKVRGIQAYGKEVKTALAGQRTAINLSGVSKEDIDRGDVIAYKDAVTVTGMIDAELSMFSSADRVVLNNSRVHLYCGSDEVLCKVILLDRDTLSAGETAYAQLRLEEPMAVRRGDRFIIRFYSPIVTVGGGRILDTNPLKHKRNRAEVLGGMEVLAEGSLSDIVYVHSCGRRFVRQAELTHELGLLESEMQSIVDEESAKGRIVVLPDGTLLGSDRFERLQSDAESIIEEYHQKNPLYDGIPRQELLSRAKAKWFTDDDRLVQAVIRYLLDAGVIEDRGKSIAVSGYRIEYTEEQLRLKKRIAGMYMDAGIEMIKNDEIFALCSDVRTARAILDDLEEDAVIRKVNPSYYIDRAAWDLAADTARSFEAAFTLAEYRDRLGTSRKYAAELLPAMDKAGVTVFDGESRKAVRRPGYRK